MHLTFVVPPTSVINSFFGIKDLVVKQIDIPTLCYANAFARPVRLSNPTIFSFLGISFMTSYHGHDPIAYSPVCAVCLHVIHVEQ